MRLGEYDLLIIWGWEYDADFVQLLLRACARRNVRAFVCDLEHLEALPHWLERGELRASVVLDRVWDWGDDYMRHVPAVKRFVPHRINEYELVEQAWNKVAMHMVVIAHGLHAPYLIALPAYDQQPVLPPPDLSPLGGRFSAKPAHGGGSGVLQPLTTWHEVLERRKEWPDDETILQAWVEPRVLGTQQRRAWFRVFYACGSTFLCWADDRTHVHDVVTPEEEQRHQLSVLRGMTQQIAGLCGLNLFSTEIALDEHNLWQVCDYVNEPCDYRLKSKTPNGVPDDIVASIADRIAGWAARRSKRGAARAA